MLRPGAPSHPAMERYHATNLCGSRSPGAIDRRCEHPPSSLAAETSRSHEPVVGDGIAHVYFRRRIGQRRSLLGARRPDTPGTVPDGRRKGPPQKLPGPRHDVFLRRLALAAPASVLLGVLAAGRHDPVAFLAQKDKGVRHGRPAGYRVGPAVLHKAPEGLRPPLRQGGPLVFQKDQPEVLLRLNHFRVGPLQRQNLVADQPKA
mmetsp:Transcript_26685/g.57227  ORF Transcript_26685/g.57227 Transcript_26685/m.57227 type:complete len:204 (-) Transcript_26685:5-616(-)